jgi:Sec23/Sec24 zinc finger
MSEARLPQVQPVRFTTHVFPRNNAVKDAAGIPWSVSLTPFLHPGDGDELADAQPADLVARCEKCFGYINPHCEVTSKWWRCPLCGTHNKFSSSASDGYRYRRSALPPELTEGILDLELPLETAHSSSKAGSGYLAKVPASTRPHIYIAVIDELGSPEYLAAVTAALLAVVTALPADSWFALLTFSDRIGLFDVAAPVPHVQYIDTAESSSSIALQDIHSLDELACHTGPHRAAMLTAVAALPALCCSSGAYVTRSSGDSVPRQRYTGESLQRLFDLILGSRTAAASDKTAFVYAGCQVVTFLAGAATAGAGCDARVLSSSSADSSADELFRGSSKAAQFYAAQAARIAAAGISVSVWAVADTPAAQCALAVVRPLAALTGGRLHYCCLNDDDSNSSTSSTAYAESPTAAMTSVLVAEALCARAYECLLRVRCSAELTVQLSSANSSSTESTMYADPRIAKLWHIAACRANDSYTLDLQAVAMSEWLGRGNDDMMFTLQSAFAYTAAVHGQTVRRLRVVTVQCEASYDAAEVSSMLEPCTVCASLLNKVRAEELLCAILRHYAVHCRRCTPGHQLFISQCLSAVSLLQLTRFMMYTSRCGKLTARCANALHDFFTQLTLCHFVIVAKHQVVLEVWRSGAQEARLLLRDWCESLIIAVCTSNSSTQTALTTARSRRRRRSSSSTGPLTPQQALRNPSIITTLQLVYGLLRSSVLLGSGSCPTDKRTAKLSEWSRLEPGLLQLAVYPKARGYAADCATVTATDVQLTRRHCDISSGTSNSSSLNNSSGVGSVIVIDALTLVAVISADSNVSAATIASTALGTWLQRRQALVAVEYPHVQTVVCCAHDVIANAVLNTVLVDDSVVDGIADCFQHFVEQLRTAAETALQIR